MRVRWAGRSWSCWCGALLAAAAVAGGLGVPAASADPGRPGGDVHGNQCLPARAHGDRQRRDHCRSGGEGASAQLAVSLTDTAGGSSLTGAGGHVAPGASITYTLVVSNTGRGTAADVLVADSLPPAFLNAAWAGSDGSSGTGPLRSTIRELRGGRSVTFTLSATVAATASGTLSDTATARSRSGRSGAVSATDTVTVESSLDLSVVVADGVTAVVPGTGAAYTITVANAGPSAASGATLVDTLPVGLTSPASSALPAGVTFTDLGNGQVEWSGLDLAAGGSLVLQLTGSIDPALAAGTNTFVDSASVQPPAGVTDVNLANNSTDDVDSVTPSALLSLSGTADGQTTATAAVGQQVTIVFTLGNGGPSDAGNVNVNDLLPAGLSLDSSSVSSGSYDPNTGVWAIGALQPGAEATLTLQATLTAGPGATDTATATADDAASTTASTTITVQ